MYSLPISSTFDKRFSFAILNDRQFLQNFCLQNLQLTKNDSQAVFWQ